MLLGVKAISISDYQLNAKLMSIFGSSCYEGRQCYLTTATVRALIRPFFCLQASDSVFVLAERVFSFKIIGF